VERYDFVFGETVTLGGEDMNKKKERIETTGRAFPLTSNPFAALSGTPAECLSEDKGVSPAPMDEKGRGSKNKFKVEKTKKGGYPVFLERRSAGKTVTVVRNVSGEAEALLTLLKKQCAAGGKAYEDSVEVQGEHCAKVEKILRDMGA
jgi:translation initiation factor 1 (eIF-1/SUI1)